LPAVDRRAALLGLLTVLAANALYLAGLPSILDALLSMDPFYMRLAGLPAAELIGQDPSWGPLYAWWFKPLRAAFGDPLAINTANVVALSLGVTLALYGYVLVLTRRAAPAVGVALAYLISDFNLPLSGKVSSFALLVLLIGLTAAALLRPGARRLSGTALVAALAGYARPELYPAGVALAAWALWRVRHEPQRNWAWPIGAGLAIAAAAVALGVPLYSPHDDASRLLIAFREHFAWNWVRWHHVVDYRTIWQSTFGDATSLSAALLANPLAFASHLAINLAMTVWFLAATAFDHYPVLVPANLPRLVHAENLAAAAVAVGILAVVLRTPTHRRAWLGRHGETLRIHALIAASPLVASIVIYPVTHYLLIPAVLLFVAVGLAATQLMPAAALSRPRAGLLAALLCLAAMPRPFVLPAAERTGASFVGRINVTRPVHDTVAYIRGLGLPAPVQVLTVTDGLGDLLGDGFEELKAWQVDQPLESYLAKHGVDLIVSLDPGKYSFMLPDEYWPKLQEDPAAGGFAQLKVPNHPEISLYVRRELVASPSPPPSRASTRP
jgi:hypothetical protein